MSNPVTWSTYARSVSSNETELLSWLIKLYIPAGYFDLDATYSTGRMWTNLPQPRYKLDLYPRTDNVVRADARRLPIRASSMVSIMFDPPFILKNTTTRVPNGIIESRFGGYGTEAALWSMYADSLTEFYRVLQPRGILAFKCQDVVAGGKQHLSHVYIINTALALGYTCEDIFILTRKSVIWSPNMANQKHARKFHCYYLVLRK